jgi:hypothetical protein
MLHFPPIPGPPRWLAVAEADGQRCAGLVILTGVVLGAGLVKLFSGPGGQTSRFSLELVVLVVLQLVGPLIVTLLAIVRLNPLWQDRGEREGGTAWRSVVLPCLPLSLLLMLMFIVAAVLAGVLASPRGDLVGEVRELLGGLRGIDVLRTLVRSSLFLVAASAWSLRLHAIGRRQQHQPGAIQNDSLMQSVTLVLVLKLFWIMGFDPIRLSLPA